MHFEQKKVIFYGAGAWLAKNLRRLQNEGYSPVCVCDRDTAKHYRPFCGNEILQVLPLDEALEKYAEIPLYVTVDHAVLGSVLHDLTANWGIAPKRILNYTPIEYRMGCPELESSIKFRTKRIFIRCYWRHPGIERGNNPAEDILRFEKWRQEVIKAIREGRPSPCDGCRYLKPGWYPVSCQTTSLQLSDSNEHSYCNFNCCYCFVHAKNKMPMDVDFEEDEQLAMLQYISENLSDKILELQFSTGELTVHPYREELLDLFAHYQTTLFTNAGIYHKKIATLMEQGLLSIVVSVDSGTRDTFCKIKNVDLYDQVCANLVQYAATGGCIILKYIMLPGINDNERDCEGFIELAVRLRAVVQLSNDTRTQRAVLPANALAIVCRLATGARENNLLVIHEKDVFAEADNMVIENAIREAGQI